MQIDRAFLKTNRSVINKALETVAKEIGCTAKEIGSISFESNNFTFRVKMFAKGSQKVTRKERSMLSIYGVTLGEQVIGLDNRLYTVVGAYQNGIIIENSAGKKYRSKRDRPFFGNLKRPNFKINECCTVLWKEDGMFYNGVITKISGTMITVKYDDDGEVETVQKNLVFSQI